MRPIALKLLCLVGFLVVAFSVVACETEEEIGKGIRHEEPEISISAVQLTSDYWTNRDKADALYRDKVLLVTGIVHRMGRDVFDIPYIDLYGDDLKVRCFFSEEQISRLASLPKGQTVTIKGKGNGLGSGLTVALRDCSSIGSP
jgi:hypothetical protein